MKRMQARHGVGFRVKVLAGFSSFGAPPSPLASHSDRSDCRHRDSACCFWTRAFVLLVGCG